MNTQIVPQTIAFDNLVQMHNQEVTTTSKIVADNFEKLHKNVLSKIDEIIAETPVEFNELNFKPIEIEVKVGFGVRKERAYEMTKDGFMLLVMGFTGKKAMELKIRFIQAFNWAFDQLQKSTSKQRDVLIRACEELSVGRMARPQAYALVANQFGYDKPIDIPVPLIAEATAFAYQMILRLKPTNEADTNNNLAITDCGKKLIHHMNYIYSWYRAIEQPFKMLSPKLNAEIHDHMQDGKIFATSLARHLSIDEPMPKKYWSISR